MSAIRLGFGVLSLAVAAGATSAGPCEPAWSEQFVNTDLNLGILDLAVFDGGSGPALYAGGLFTYAGEAKANRLARLEGNKWMPLPAEVDASVLALGACEQCPDPGPALYVGGHFQSAGDTAVQHVARWDGNAWSPLGEGVSGAPTAVVDALLVVENGPGGKAVLYAGGYFESAGGAPARSIAMWDGSSWSAMGSGLEGVVGALAIFDDGNGPALYAGGSFTMSGGVTVNNIARWDGSSWSPVGGGTDGSVAALAVHDDGSGPALYAGGPFVTAGGIAAVGIARWDGSTWSAVPGIPLGAIYELLTFNDGSGDVLLASGWFPSTGLLGAVMRWDGASWSTMGSTFSSTAWALGVVNEGSPAAPVLYAGGFFDDVATLGTARIARWDGTDWRPVSDAVNDYVSALKVFDDGSGSGPALYAGGAFSAAGTAAAGAVARWDGSDWSALGAGIYGYVNAITAFDDGSGPDLYVGGNFDMAGSVPASSIARWNGSEWSAVGEGLDGYIYTLTVFDDGNGPALYAGGYFDLPDAEDCSVARWDGSAWSCVGTTAQAPGYVRALAVYNDGTGGGPSLYAGGTFGSIDGVAANRIARWDGSKWSAVGAGFEEGAVYALTVYDDGSGPALFAGGYFNFDPWDCVVARWNGSQWSCAGIGEAAPGQSNPGVVALTLYNDGTGDGTRLYAAGSFVAIDGVEASAIAAWDGTQWSPLGSGIDVHEYGYYVQDLAVFDDGSSDGPALYAGGLFDTAGDLSSPNFARWSGCAVHVPGDLTGDGVVNQADLGALLGAWGACPGGCGPACPADLNGDCAVGTVDFLILLANWT